MKKTLLVMLLLLVLLLAFITIRFGSALIQEGNPIPILTSIIKLELSNSDYQKVSDEKNRHRFVSKNTGKSRHDVVKEYMKEKDWDFKEQIGAGLVFEKNKEVITISTRQYSRQYFLWDVPLEVNVKM